MEYLSTLVNSSGKIEMKSVIVNNKVNKIISLCEARPITFRFVEGCQNPGDLSTRAVSIYIMKRSNFLAGPSKEVLLDDYEELVIPEATGSVSVCLSALVFEDSLIDIDKYSSFHKCSRILNYVYGFINRLKTKLYLGSPSKYLKFKELPNSFVLSQEYLIRKAQEKSFKNVFRFFRGEQVACDSIVTQLNL